MGVDRARDLVALTRPWNAVAAGSLSFVGAVVAADLLSSSLALPTSQAVGATILATAGGNAINDYVDRDIDRRNRPERPIPRGAVDARTALTLAVVLFLGAAALALPLPRVALGIALLNLLLLAAYTSVFKALPGVGNAVVSWLVGSAFLFGAAAVGNAPAAVVLGALAGGATFAREVVKDVEDRAGDEAAGLRTLPILIGSRPAIAVGTGVLLVAVLASPLPYLRETLGIPYLAVVAVADVVMLAGAARSFDDPSIGQRWLKAGMLVAVGAFVLGRLAAA